MAVLRGRRCREQEELGARIDAAMAEDAAVGRQPEPTVRQDELDLGRGRGDSGTVTANSDLHAGYGG